MKAFLINALVPTCRPGPEPRQVNNLGAGRAADGAREKRQTLQKILLAAFRSDLKRKKKEALVAAATKAERV